MSGKGSISRMSDECLMTQEFGFPFYTQYQAVMRKFTLAGKIMCVVCFIAKKCEEAKMCKNFDSYLELKTDGLTLIFSRYTQVLPKPYPSHSQVLRCSMDLGRTWLWLVNLPSGTVLFAAMGCCSKLKLLLKN